MGLFGILKYKTILNNNLNKNRNKFYIKTTLLTTNKYFYCAESNAHDRTNNERSYWLFDFLYVEPRGHA